MQFVEAFAKYGATLKNPQWSVSAVNASGELVVSLWEHHFPSRAKDGKIRCTDRVSRWSGPGNTAFRAHIDNAFKTGQVVRLIVARAANTEAVERGDNASDVKKTFSLKEGWFGKVTSWDGERYEIEFEIRHP